MKIKFFLLLLCVGVFFSCQKSGMEPVNDGGFQLNSKSMKIIFNSNSVYNEFKQMDYGHARSAFQTLSSTEIQSLHLAKMLDFMEGTKLNSMQVENLKLLQDIILIAPDRENLNAEEQIWLEKAKQVFSDYEIFTLAYAFKILSKEDFKNANDLLMSSVKGPVVISVTPSCVCNTTSKFACIGGFAGGCKAKKCDKKTSGCGFLTFYECEGRCTPG